MVTWGDVARLWDGQFVVRAVAAAAVTGEDAARPGGIVVGQVDAAVVPRVPVGVEAPGRLDRDERRLGHVARALKERVVDGVGAVLASV